MKRSKQKEFGDFQTPEAMSDEICRFLYEQGQRPSSILEPTCGRGSLLLSALDHFASATCALGLDINPKHVQHLETVLAARTDAARVQVRQGDFFDTGWTDILDSLPDPLLVIGNPPWVTSSELAGLSSLNLPPKTNPE